MTPTLAVIVASSAVLVCASAAAPKPPNNSLSDAEKAAGWVLLFDGKNAGASLRGYKRADLPAEWKVEDGCIVLRGTGGDIVTKDQFKDFEFSCDWNVAPGGNSGIMWHVSEEFSYPWETGPEMQVLDDERHGDGKSRLTSAGACYALYPAPEGAVRPAGEWNTAVIRVEGPKVTYLLNGVKTAEFDMSSQEWKDRIKGSKFASMPNFASRPSGHIALQDHGDVVKYRNLKVRPIGAPAAAPVAEPSAAIPPSEAPATP
jgi:hypothetical protein